MKTKRNKNQGFLAFVLDGINYFALLIILLLLWHYASVKEVFSNLLLPSMSQVVTSTVEQSKSGQLWQDIFVSLSTVIRGYLVGAGLGIVFGLFMGMFHRVNKFFAFVFDAIRQIPGIALFPLIILWFGIGATSKIILVARGAFFPVLVNTITGIQTTNPRYLDLVKLYGVTPYECITKIYIPSALPYICTGLRLAAGTAWMSVVAAEMLGASKGLGFRIENAQQLMQSDIMLVDIFVIGILGWFIDVLLKRFTGILNRWERQ